MYSLAPPDDFFKNANNYITSNEFYTTAGLDGIVLSPTWSDMEGSQGDTTKFQSAIGDTLAEMFAQNPNLYFVLGVGGVLATPPTYILRGPVIYEGSSYTIGSVLINFNTGDGNYNTQAVPFPFDPAFSSCYLTMLTNALTYLAGQKLPGSSETYLSRMSGVKLGLYACNDLELSIPYIGSEGQDQSQAWLTAFTTPGANYNPPSSWPGYLADQWVSVVQGAFTEFTKLLSNALVKAKVHAPPFSAPPVLRGFPLISSSGTLLPPGTDYSSFPIDMLIDAASMVGTPNALAAIDTSLTVTLTAPESIFYNSDFNGLKNSSSVPTYLAFQTNGFDSSHQYNVNTICAASGRNSDGYTPSSLNPNVVADCNTFIYLIENGLTQPTNGAGYSPYIELHYGDIAKWGNANSYHSNALGTNVLESIHKTVFGD
jgi:hypothetical protein